MRLGTDWPSNETEAHHLSLFAEMGEHCLLSCIGEQESALGQKLTPWRWAVR